MRASHEVPTDDEAAARQALGGGDLRTAVGLLMDLYGRPIYRYACRLVGDADLAQDVLQTTFLQAYQDLPRFGGRSSLRVWLYGIARHRCFDAAKAARRRRWRFLPLPDEPEGAFPHAVPSNALGEDELGRALARCLQALKPEVRAAVILRFQEDFSYPGDGGYLRGAARDAASARGPSAARPPPLPRAPGAAAMSRCTRFEDEGLLQLEQGLPLDAHFNSCGDCEEARASYARIRGGLASLDEAIEAPAGWRDRVWKAIDDTRARRNPRHAWWIAPAALAAAVALAVLVRPRPARPPSPQLDVSVQSGGTVRRTRESQPGDRLRLHTATGAQGQAELRVYLNDRALVLRCSIEPPCESEPGGLAATLTVAERGTYQPALFTSARALPAPVGDLERDVEAAFQAGTEVVLGQEIRVK